DEDEPDRDVRHLAVDVVVGDRPARAERDHGERGEGGAGRDDGREDVRNVVGGLREEALLADELQEVGDRLQKTERPGAVRPVAVLEASEELPLEPRRVRECGHHEVDEDRRLDERDPPDLSHLLTSTEVCRSPACSSAIRTTPGRSSRVRRARSVTDVPFDRTVTSSPLWIPRACASGSASCTSASGRWNCSSGTRSTAAPEKRGR